MTQYLRRQPSRQIFTLDLRHLRYALTITPVAICASWGKIETVDLPQPTSQSRQGMIKRSISKKSHPSGR
jgi:hypothetical protein